MRKLLLWMCFIIAGCAPKPATIFSAVAEDNGGYIGEWIKKGGNPNITDGRGESLLYIATGPHGGHSALAALLEGGADPDRGSGSYTPLMNAASWVDLKGVQLLLAHGANPNLKNSERQTALDVVGQSGGAERLVIDELRKVTHAK